MEEYLRHLGHARDGLDGEVTEAVDCPGILVGFDEAAAIRCIGQEIESKLRIRLYRVDATKEEESKGCVSVVIDVRHVLKTYW